MGGHSISTDTIDKLSQFFGCNVGDVACCIADSTAPIATEVRPSKTANRAKTTSASRTTSTRRKPGTKAA
jgi:hypothetical protein